MNEKLQKLLQTLIPFIMLGIVAALCIGFIIMFSSILIWGIFIGGLLWIGALAKSFFFPDKDLSKSEGRIIEHNDRK